MKKITIQDVRTAIKKVAENQHTHSVLENLNDEELFKRSIGNDLGMFSSQIGGVIAQLCKDKNLRLPHELHKVLPNNRVESIVEIVNQCIQEEEKMGIYKVY